jgi:hypothetical protein
MNDKYDRQRLREAIDNYLIRSSVAPGFTPTHLNKTKDLIRLIVSEQSGMEHNFVEVLHHCMTELNKWELVMYERNDLAYTLLAIKIQKELRRLKDVYHLY